LGKKQSQQGRGRSLAPNKIKGVSHEMAHKSKYETKKSQSLEKRRKFPRKTWWWKEFF
jgi:hypothetical protein